MTKGGDAMRRKGFTLIELMVVVTVIVILMSIAFRLAGITSSREAYAVTQKRLQGLNNALSGYYAAYGSYPPVKLHASRNIYMKADSGGIQDEDGKTESGLHWANVRAALLAQPVGVAYPFGENSDYVKQVSDALREKANSGDPDDKEFAANEALKYGFDALTRPGAELGKYKDSPNFNEAPVFMFGVLSYLLPRYLFMTRGDSQLYRLPQWTYNNEEQKQAYGDGSTEYTWDQIRQDINNNGSKGRIRVQMLPSQSVCARWMPNLEGIISGGETFFGVNTAVTVNGMVTTTFHGNNPYIRIYCPTGNRSQQYVLDGMSVQDGWGRDYYYYSQPPYQGYRLWSAGPDGKTFAPWVELSALPKDQQKTAAGWMADDVE